jgi:hypothetical protein
LLISVDAKGYGGGHDQRHVSVQRMLTEALDEAAANAGLNRRRWLKQGNGDGELALLPQTEPEPRVVEDFVRELDAALARRNRDVRSAARLRLRLAIHHGMAAPASNGFAGQGVVAVSRLVDSEPLRAALDAASGANLAVILSHRVFTDSVAQWHTSLRPAELRKVRVSNKEFTEDAWLLVPGYDVHGLDLRRVPDLPDVAPESQRSTVPQDADRRAEQDPRVVNAFHGAVDARGAVFGIVHRGERDG